MNRRMYAKVSGQYLNMIGCNEVLLKGGFDSKLCWILSVIGDNADVTNTSHK